MRRIPARLIAPPDKPYSCCGSWSLFERRFEPIVHEDDCLLWEVGTLPKPLDPREWWTVLDCDGALFVVAGLRFVNRFAYIRCRNRWRGDCDDHPDYRYDSEPDR